MQNDEEEKDGAGAPVSPDESSSRALYKVLPFLFILLFLIAGGYYAITSMRQSAHQLAGGSNYTQLSANNVVYEGNASLPREKNYFSSEEASLASAGDAGGDRMKLRGKLGAQEEDFSQPAPSVASGRDGEDHAARENGPAPRPLPTHTSMANRMQVKSSSFMSPGGGHTKTGGKVEGRQEAFQKPGAAVGVTSVQKNPQAAGPTKGGKGGVLDSLRGAFRASVYGARIASQDSAKSWIAKTFDATPAETSTIQYDDKAKASLDVVNPNSIPKFLREQDVSAAKADTLPVSKVTNPALDKEGQAKLDEEKAEEEGGLAKGMASGMMNSMFGGFSLSDDSDGGDSRSLTSGNTDEAGGDGLDAMSSDEDLVSVDEFGYISYGDPAGTQYVFDPDGNLMGCTDNAAGFSIPAGNSGCP